MSGKCFGLWIGFVSCAFSAFAMKPIRSPADSMRNMQLIQNSLSEQRDSTKTMEIQDVLDQHLKRKQGNPYLKSLGQVLAGSVLGAATGYYGAGFAVSVTEMSKGREYMMLLGWTSLFTDHSDDPAVLIGFLSGMALGSSAGICALGGSDGGGSFAATLLGSSLGVVAGWLITGQDAFTYPSFLIPAFSGAVCGTIGYRLSIRKNGPDLTGVSLIQVSENRLSVRVPPVSIQPHPYNKNKWVATVNILDLVF